MDRWWYGQPGLMGLAKWTGAKAMTPECTLLISSSFAVETLVTTYVLAAKASQRNGLANE
jgi:hypothetical protein